MAEEEPRHLGITRKDVIAWLDNMGDSAQRGVLQEFFTRGPGASLGRRYKLEFSIDLAILSGILVTSERR